MPLLDHRVVEFAWRLPQAALDPRRYQQVAAARKCFIAMCRRELVERPKMGFAIPLGEWLRGPLRSWAENLLTEQKLREGGYFDPAVVRQVWDDHVSGRRNCEYMLWNVLMFEAWRERWG